MTIGETMRCEACGKECMCRSNSQKYCEACREKKARERKRRYRKANPEKVREKDRRRRIANPEKARERNRRWCEANPQRYLDQYVRNKLGMRKSEWPALFEAKRLQVLAFRMVKQKKKETKNG